MYAWNGPPLGPSWGMADLVSIAVEPTVAIPLLPFAIALGLVLFVGAVSAGHSLWTRVASRRRLRLRARSLAGGAAGASARRVTG